MYIYIYIYASALRSCAVFVGLPRLGIARAAYGRPSRRAACFEAADWGYKLIVIIIVMIIIIVVIIVIIVIAPRPSGEPLVSHCRPTGLRRRDPAVEGESLYDQNLNSYTVFMYTVFSRGLLPKYSNNRSVHNHHRVGLRRNTIHMRKLLG